MKFSLDIIKFSYSLRRDASVYAVRFGVFRDNGSTSDDAAGSHIHAGHDDGASSDPAAVAYRDSFVPRVAATNLRSSDAVRRGKTHCTRADLDMGPHCHLGAGVDKNASIEVAAFPSRQLVSVYETSGLDVSMPKFPPA
jgi:hypothetical protein